MDRDTIYLDNDDEITSVVDKLKGSDFSSIDLVIPKEALVLKSVVNLKLLKKQAESLGKEIVIVTQDKVGKKLAAQIGIPVINKPGEEPKEVHMTEGEEPAKVVAAATAGAAAGLAAKELSDDDIEIKKNAKPATVDEESDGIEFKEPATPIEPTSEVVGSASNSAKAPPDKKVTDKPTGRGRKKLTWKFWLIAGGFAALAIFVAAYIFIPLANIDVTLASEKKSVDFNFTADKSYTSVDTTAQTIPAAIVTAEVTKDQEYPATGKKKTGTKATGTVTLYNNGYDSDPTTIVAGSRLVTSGGLVFRTSSNATIPGSYLDKGNVVVTNVNVQAEADQVGANYNIAASTDLSVPAIGSSKIYGRAASAFAGGTSRDITYVTQTDVNAAKEDMAKQIEKELVDAANKKAGTDVRLIDKAYKITQISATANPDVNGEGANFTLTVKAKIDALVFKEDDLTKLAASVLGDQIGSGKEIVDKSSLTSAAEFTEGDFEKGNMKVKVSGEAYIAAKLVENEVKTQIAGEPNEKALEYLRGLDGVSDAQITRQFPSFLRRIPRVKSHIYLKINLDKSQ